MSITKFFYNDLSTGNVMGIRIMMKDSLLVDPTFQEFKEMEALTQNMAGLYDVHDGKEFVYDKAAWNDDYMNKLMVQIVRNFSHERLEHLQDVVRYLRPVTAHTETKLPPSEHNANTQSHHTASNSWQTKYQAEKQRDERENKIINNSSTKIAAGAAAGAVVGATIAAIAGSSVAVGASVGAVAVGIVVAVSANGGH